MLITQPCISNSLWVYVIFAIGNHKNNKNIQTGNCCLVHICDWHIALISQYSLVTNSLYEGYHCNKSSDFGEDLVDQNIRRHMICYGGWIGSNAKPLQCNKQHTFRCILKEIRYHTKHLYTCIYINETINSFTFSNAEIFCEILSTI